MTDTQSDAETEAQAEPATVLVVEDETDLADLYAAWLADTYDTRTAYSGEEALNQLDETIDVVLLDRRMPDVSGDDVLADIREQDLDCRVVIVSAVTPDFDVIDMGFDDYLTKPVDADELHDAVERMLTRAEYDETFQENYQLVATRATLEAEKSDAELRLSDEYAALQEQIEEVEVAADAAIDEDFEATFHELDPARRDVDSDTDSSDGDPE